MKEADISSQYLGNFLTIQIPFSQENHASVFFAHLQNILKQICLSLNLQDNLQFSKADRVLYDIYLENKKLQANYETVQGGIKQLMTEFGKMIQDCRNDKENLAKSLEERQSLLERLKETNQQVHEALIENQMMKETVKRLTQLNGLISEKNQVLEEQAQNFKISVLGMEDYKRINTEYDRLLASNRDMHKDLLEISQQTEQLEKISDPFKIICAAFKENTSMVENVWEMAEKNVSIPELFFGKNIEKVKQNFHKFQFHKFVRMHGQKQPAKQE